MKKNIKRILSTFVALSIAMSFATTAFAASPSFTDVPANHWSYAAVEKAVANSLVNGMGDGKYAPDRSVSYAEWATMVTNLFYASDVAKLKTLSPTAPWYVNPFRVTYYYKIFEGAGCNYTGYGTNTDVDPQLAYVHDVITRYDMALTIYNLSNVQGWASVDTANISASIADWSSVPANYQTAVAYCYASGFITGVDQNGTFAGTSPMTRGAAAVVLCRLLDAKNGEHSFDADNSDKDISASTGAAVIDMITVTRTGTTNDGSTKYKITLDVPAYNGTTLTNGKPITVENIQAMLKELEAIFPDGTSWGDSKAGDNYYYGLINACNAFAYMTRDLLYGTGSMGYATKHSDLTALKVGDLVYLANKSNGYEHWVVVTDLDFEIGDTWIKNNFISCSGNNNAMVSWGGISNIPMLVEGRPDSTVYSFY